jgi:2-(1,2-epoxy-1,2-dihydrophenyl)acetyl-CoA isomerase
VNGLVVEQRDAVLWIRLNRPETGNAISPLMLADLRAALKSAERDDTVRAVVITGTGRHFCVGSDNGQSADETAPEPGTGLISDITDYSDLFRTCWELSKPLVAAVNGTAAGVGVLLALVCDLVLAAAESRFVPAFWRRGMTPHAGDPFVLSRVFPLHRLMEFVLLGEAYSAEQLHAWNVINRVVAPGDLDAQTQLLAGRIAAGPTFALGQARRLYHAALETSFAASGVADAAAFAAVTATADFAEGTKALGDRRPPSFTGR